MEQEELTYNFIIQYFAEKKELLNIDLISIDVQPSGDEDTDRTNAFYEINMTATNNANVMKLRGYPIEEFEVSLVKK